MSKLIKRSVQINQIILQINQIKLKVYEQKSKLIDEIQNYLKKLNGVECTPCSLWLIF